MAWMIDTEASGAVSVCGRNSEREEGDELPMGWAESCSSRPKCTVALGLFYFLFSLISFQLCFANCLGTK
jgi:hypothetical protein